MYNFEKKIKQAEISGMKLSEGQMTYIRCARINGIDLLDHLYNRYSHDFILNGSDEKSCEYLAILTTILTISDFFDKTLCELVEQMIEQNRKQ